MDFVVDESLWSPHMCNDTLSAVLLSLTTSRFAPKSVLFSHSIPDKKQQNNVHDAKSIKTRAIRKKRQLRKIITRGRRSLETFILSNNWRDLSVFLYVNVAGLRLYPNVSGWTKGAVVHSGDVHTYPVLSGIWVITRALCRDVGMFAETFRCQFQHVWFLYDPSAPSYLGAWCWKRIRCETVARELCTDNMQSFQLFHGRNVISSVIASRYIQIYIYIYILLNVKQKSLRAVNTG